MRLVTRELVEARLRITVPPSTAEELDFLAAIEQAEALVIDVINQRRSDGDLWAAEVDAWNVEDTTALPPANVQLAVLVQTAEIYRFRGDDTGSDQPARGPGEVLHPRAMGYLYRHRDPAVS